MRRSLCGVVALALLVGMMLGGGPQGSPASAAAHPHEVGGLFIVAEDTVRLASHERGLVDSAAPVGGLAAQDFGTTTGVLTSCVPITTATFTCLTYEVLFGRSLDCEAFVQGTAPITYTWSYGDGAVEVFSGPAMSHMYTQTGDFTVVLTATNCSGQGLATAAHTVTVALVHATPIREYYGYGLATDFDVAVGSSRDQYAFWVECGGAYTTSLSITHDNPHFTVTWAPSFIYCDISTFIHAVFAPDEPGLTVDHVTVTTGLATVFLDLVGNGVVAEMPMTWTADLGAQSSAARLAYDGGRDLLYITDGGTDQVLVFSPADRAVIAQIPVGHFPYGLAMAPNGQRLYVANSGEQSISVVDLNSWVELYKIPLPSLGPFPGYTPYDIAVVSDTLALIGSDPPGAASGGPIYELDLETEQVAPRADIGSGAWPQLRSSYNFSATGILLEPGASPTYLARYDPATDSSIAIAGDIEGTLAVNYDGTRLATSGYFNNALRPEITLYDQDLHLIRRIQLLGGKALSLAFSPRARQYLYGVEDQLGTYAIGEVDTNVLLQTRDLPLTMPYGYAPLEHALTVSADGQWAYVLLCQTWCTPPTKLLAVRVEPPDTTPPFSSIFPLDPTQLHNWWIVRWSGSDDLSGIDYYEIQYRVGLVGQWVNWLRTASDRGLFSHAIPGETYCFRGRAVDRAGNVEPYPAEYETCTVAGDDPGGLSHIYLPVIFQGISP